MVLGTGKVNGPLMVKADHGATGYMYVGNNGSADVTSATGMPLDAGDVIIFNYVGDLNTIWVDASATHASSECVYWLMLGPQ